MAEYQVELEFQVEGHERDVELLERLADELEREAGETGPAVAIHGDVYSVTMIVQEQSAIGATERAMQAITSAGEAALGEAVRWRSGRLAVGEELVPA